MPEYKDEKIKRWFVAYHKIHDITELNSNANLISRNMGVDYLERVLISAKKIPKRLRDDSLKQRISILERTVKIEEEKVEKK